MTEKLNPIARLDELSLEPFEQGEHYRSLDADISDRVGLTQIGAALCIVMAVTNPDALHRTTRQVRLPFP